MGYDRVQGPNTYGSGCMEGAQRMFKWFREKFEAGSLGCYNPASLKGMSLHAEGRAMDIALNANDDDERARGDAIVTLVSEHPEWFGAQEMLWRGRIWSWNKRSLGVRYPLPDGEQKAAHMNHVHLGIDVYAAEHWTPDWVEDMEEEMNWSELEIHVAAAVNKALDMKEVQDKVRLLVIDAINKEEKEGD